MVTTPDGNIYVKHLQTTNPVVTIGDTTYCFRTNRNICITIVAPEHLDKILSIKKSCCGGSSRPKYFLANELDVERWSKP